ncbi:MAG TPA: hypothetical protein VHZ03_30265 [Trebonia sp.]|nr:hypothetical protein [Trebonia sp.]
MAAFGWDTIDTRDPAARWNGYVLAGALIAAGDLPAAEDVCAAGLAQCRNAGDVGNLDGLLPHIVKVDPSADRLQDAAEHLPAAFQTAVLDGGCLEMLNLDCCRHWCAATGRSAEAVTV